MTLLELPFNKILQICDVQQKFAAAALPVCFSTNHLLIRLPFVCLADAVSGYIRAPCSIAGTRRGIASLSIK
jgi:hypothetical protein